MTMLRMLIKSKLKKETAKVDYNLLKQRIAHHYLSDLFTSFQLPPPPALETIVDPSLRQRLTYRYEQLIQRTKSEMMMIHIRTAEIKMDDYNKAFDADLKKFYQQQRFSDVSARFNTRMVVLMEERFQRIDERVQLLFDLKVRFFVKAPTVNQY